MSLSIGEKNRIKTMSDKKLTDAIVATANALMQARNPYQMKKTSEYRNAILAEMKTRQIRGCSK